MTKLLEQKTDKVVDDMFNEVKAAACTENGDVNEIIHRHYNALISSYLRQRSRHKLEIAPALMEKYKAELLEARTIIADSANRLFFHYRRRREIAKIEFPALESIVKEGMTRQGIPYMFATVKDENLMTVQVVNEHFFRIPITMKNVEQVLGLMKYFLHRPDCAVEEMPQIRRFRNYRLAKDWTRLTKS